MKEIYQARQAKLCEFLQANNQDVGIIMSPTNIYYFTGFQANPHERFLALVIDQNATSRLFLPALDLQAAKKAASVKSCIPVSDTEDAYAIFFNEVGNVESLAVEKNYLTVSQFESFATYYANRNFTELDAFILTLRKVKSAEEIEQVRAAIAITEKGLKNTLKKISLGQTEFQVKAMLEYELTLLGAEGFAFETTVLTGRNSALPHGTSGERFIETGDFLLMDFGIYLNGYVSDITRTFLVGEGTVEQRKIYETVLAANEAAIDSVIAGKQLQAIDLAARNVIEEAGYGEYFTHRVGHGMGLDVHEAPSIHHENQEFMEAGLLFTIEPGIYIPELGGVRIEDDIYINHAGEVEVLTSYPKQLQFISI